MRNSNFVHSLSHTKEKKKNTHLSPTERRNEGCEEGSGTDGKIISGGSRGNLQESKKRKWKGQWAPLVRSVQHIMHAVKRGFSDCGLNCRRH